MIDELERAERVAKESKSMGDLIRRGDQDTRGYYEGVRQGIAVFRVFKKDGTEYVGTSGKTLKEANEMIDKMEREELEKQGI